MGIETGEADKLIEKAIIGGEIAGETKIDEWLEERFFPNCVLIDEPGYAQMCVDALKILGSTAPTDYGSSRQRDLGQLWADMTRGYLGELAFILFLRKRWNIEADLGHEIGNLDAYLPMDIHEVRLSSEEKFRAPKIGISIKAAKWNAIWLDIPGAQFHHSDIHALVKVGAGRDHLFAFFKTISVFKDKVLKRGEDVGSLTKEEAQSLYDSLPTFKPIPAYICGFIKKSNAHRELSYEGRKGRKHYKITAWNGPISNGDLERIKLAEGITGKVIFEGINEFSHNAGFLFNIGNLRWRAEEWNEVVNSL
ncbi:MAG: hypothetical protein ACE5DO_07600 [Desulfobacterales bacterium]